MTLPISSLPRDSSETVALTHRLTLWLERAGISEGEQRATLAVGLADVLAAAVRTAESVDKLLATDPTAIRGADDALTETGIMQAWLFTEMSSHLEEMAPLWESVLQETLGRLLPPDVEE